MQRNATQPALLQVIETAVREGVHRGADAAAVPDREGVGVVATLPSEGEALLREEEEAGAEAGGGGGVEAEAEEGEGEDPGEREGRD